jgi:cell division protein FtsN
MKQVILIIIVLFIAALIYLITQQPKDITLEDMIKYIPPTAAPNTNPEESYSQETTLIDSSKTDVDDTLQFDYYIVVESFKNLTLAQQKAEKLKTALNADIIVLPPTTEGYYRLSYGKYSTIEEARSIINSVRSKFKSDVWIYTAKK